MSCVQKTLAFVILILSLWVAATGQVSTGAPPFASLGGGPFDVVNLGNLNVHFSIPIFSRAGRGASLRYSLSYDSLVWVPATVNGVQQWQPAFNWGWTAQSVVPTGYLTYLLYNQKCDDGSGHQSTEYRNWLYHDQWGIVHSFGVGLGGRLVYDPYNCAFPPGTKSTLQVTATDGSGITLNTSLVGQGLGTSTVTMKNGTVFKPPLNVTGGYSGSSASLTDANGNQVSVSSTSNSATFTDTLGTIALTVSGTSPVSFSYTAPSGGQAEYTLNYVQYTVETNFGVSGISEYGRLSNALVDNIQLPDGNKYSFTYEKTPGSCTPLSGTYSANCVTGRIASVTLPAGGAVTYSYSGGTGNTGIFSDGSTAGLTRVLSPSISCSSGGCWQYARTLEHGTPGTGSSWQTSVTDPANNVTVLDFAEDASTTAPSYNLYETQRLSYQGSSTLLRTTITCYNAVYANCNNTSSYTVTSPITQIDAYAALPNGSTRLSEIAYNSVGLVTDDKEYDYGVATGAAPGTNHLIRETSTAYASLGNGIVNKPSSVVVKDWTSGTAVTIASTSYTYDGASVTSTSNTPQHVSVSGSRGNLTTIQTKATSATSLYRQFTYYDTGRLNTSTDVDTSSATTCANKPSICTTYNYSSSTASCGNTFATSISAPLGLSRSTVWNCSGGVAAQNTDENGQSVSANYASDPYFWRPASVTDQLNNQTNLAYTGETAVEAALQNFNGGNSASDWLTTVDGFGRPIFGQRKQSPTSTNYDTVETDYNNLGQSYRTTMPYAATASPSSSNPSAPATTRTYDALGRVLSIVDADNGEVSYTYTNNDVLQAVSGSQTFQKQFEYDGLGRLTSVCEISLTLPGVGTCSQGTAQMGYWTKYTYDALGHLLTVTQNAQAASGSQQTRSFAYDMLGRMTSESNPEIGNNGTNGIVTYTYDSISPCADGVNYSYPGNLVQKKDNAGDYTCYKYDVLHRVIQAGNSAVSNTTLRKFVYDLESSYPAGVSVTYGKTRLVEAQTVNTSNLNTVLTDEFFSYDKRGEITDVYESTPHSGGYYHAQASYWPTGMMDSLNLYNATPSAMFPAINYGASDGSGLDGEGRVTKVTAASGEWPLKCCVTYSAGSPTAPLGALTSVTYGSGDGDSFTYDPNTGRMVTYTFTVGGNADSGSLTWNTNGTLQKLVINDQIPGTSDSQTCTYGYDDVQRISNVTCGTFWVQNFTYDAFGNITKNVPQGDGGQAFLPSYWTSPPTNQLLSLPGVSPRYDANGNLLTDNLNAYTWDPNWGNMLTVNTGSATVTALYDALGRMVENNSGGNYSEFIYSPSGAKLAKVNGQALINAFIALPGGGKAIYNSSGVLAHFRHSDWLGSSRVTSTGTQTLYSSSAYAPFGEQYATSGNSDASYTGQDSDTVSSLYDFPARRQSPSQGRWISPDPAGRAVAILTNPQSWNRYAYALNNPLALADATGLSPTGRRLHRMDECDDGSNCITFIESGDDDGGSGGDADDDDDNSGDDNSGNNCDPNDPTCGDPTDPSDPNKQQMVLGLLNSACNAMYGGLANGIRDLAATQYTTVGSFNPTDANGQLALANAQAAFANGSPDPAYTQYFNNDNPQNPPSSTTFLAVTFLQPSFYQFSPADQMGILFHELKHAAGYGGEIDPPANATPDQVNAWDANELQTNEQNCSPQQVATQDSQVDGTIQ
ncbi:MAG TPA: RHS repeat-associated core domain-containing protein [Silvibacterium sp.]|nr:RHS repeat-associated core domain-containing protein [Silvibacterium sp.]